MKSTFINPEKWNVFSAIADEYEEIGEYDLAETYWNKCHAIEQSCGSYSAPRYIAERADFLYRQDRLEEATEAYEKALEVLKSVEDNRMSLDNLKICAKVVNHLIYSYLWFGKNNPEEKYHNELNVRLTSIFQHKAIMVMKK